MNTNTRSATLRRYVQALAFILTAALPALGHGAVAMVTDLQGKAAVTGAGQPRDVTILSELAPGAQVQLSAGATLVTLYLDSGDEYVFRGPALIAFKPGQPGVINGAKPEKRGPSLGSSGRDIRIKPVGIAQAATVMRSSPSSARVKLLNPRATRTLETEPEFRWQALEPSLKYQFEIADESGRTLHETQLDATSLTLPSSVRMSEGVTYTWKVSARLSDGRRYSSAADFSVAPAEVRIQATALRPPPTAPLSTRIAYAAWLEQMDLKDEARKYWQAALAERPEDPRLKALAEP